MPGHRQDRPDGLRPPRPGQPIRAAYLRQEHRARKARQSPGGRPSIGRFFAPAAGIGAPTVSGQVVTPGQASCVPARWTGAKWEPDTAAAQEVVYNSWKGETIPGNALVVCDWAADDHWEAMPFSCTGYA